MVIIDVSVVSVIINEVRIQDFWRTMKDFALVASASRMPFCQIKFLRFLYKGAPSFKPRVGFYIEKSRKYDFEKARAGDSSENKNQHICSS
jgi:hypothetical protein